MRPGSTRAVMLSSSRSRRRFIPRKSRTTPPFTGREPPENPVPAPRGTRGRRQRFAAVTTFCTSSAFRGRTTPAGKTKTCRFTVESHKAEGHRIPDAIDKHIVENLFIPEDFEAYILAAAPNNEPVGKIMKELKEPRPNGLDCIPWLGETLMKENIIRLCAKGLIAINLRGMEYLQVQDGESEDSAWTRMRGKLGSGKHLDETHILLPQNIPGSTKPSDTNTGVGPVFPPGKPPPPTPPGFNEPVPPTGGGGAPVPPDIFGKSPGFTQHTIPPTSSLNLLGKIEGLGIKAGTQIKSLVLRVNQLTGAQLSDLVKKLPDGMTYELGLEKEKTE